MIETLAYQNLPDQPRRMLRLPWWFCAVSLLPAAALIRVVFTNGHWSGERFIEMYTNLDHERFTGVFWMGVAAISLVCICFIIRSRKTVFVWVCLALHSVVVLLTIFPGSFIILFLMHWGPGGPGW
jgi:hypothetical protein